MPNEKPVWAETWTLSEGKTRFIRTPGSDGVFGELDHYFSAEHDRPIVDVLQDDEDRARAILASAAPEAVRALLAVEWAGMELSAHGEAEGACCPDCEGSAPDEPGFDPKGHLPACALDAALTAAGLPPESRDAARKTLLLHAAVCEAIEGTRSLIDPLPEGDGGGSTMIPELPPCPFEPPKRGP